MKQHTIHRPYKFTGRGIHSGKSVTMTLLPAPENHGIVFQRIDKGDNQLVCANASNICHTRRSTCLRENRIKVRTPEHILAALYGMGVDNVLILLDNVEVPIMDGGAKVFAEAIKADGLVEQKDEKRFIVPKGKFEFEDKKSGARITVEPAEEPSFEVVIDFNSKVLGVQKACFDNSVDFATEIAPCRTFCFYKDIRMLKAMGLIKGGTLDNALVIDEPKGYYGGATPLFPDECARHKLLDVIGDFALAGNAIKGKITAYKPGHKFNGEALQAFLKII